MTPFNLEIITPDGIFFRGTTENIIVRTTVGDKGVLARHEPYAAALDTGRIRVMVGGEFYSAAISAGIIKVDEEKTLILAQSCEWAKKPYGFRWGEEIDIERAERAKSEAEKKLATPHLSEKDLAIAEFKLKRALNRLYTAGK
jgi:F-type H+-transporting ATPase subunit epsilon